MKFCKNCGDQLSSEAEFCTSCGERTLVSNELMVNKKHRTTDLEETPRLPMKLWKKISLFSVITLIILLIGTHLFMKNMYDPQKKIEAMNLAFHNQDEKAFFEQFHLQDDASGNARHFYSAVKARGWNDLRNDLAKEAMIVTDNRKNSSAVTIENPSISVASKTVVPGLYKEVTFTILPTEVSLKIPYKGTKLMFDGKEFNSKEDDEQVLLGSYIPGEYEWSYTAPGPFMPLLGKGKHIVKADENNQQNATLDWEATTIRIDSNVRDAIVFIDGKSTKKTVKELSKLYPSQINENVKVHAVTNDNKGTEISSDTATLSKKTVYLTFKHVEEERKAKQKQNLAVEQANEIRQLFKNFRNDYENAIDYIDFDYIEDYFPEGSEIRRDYAKFVIDHRNILDYHYDFLLNDITSVSQVSEDTFELYSFETFNFYSYEDGDLHYERKKKYVFKKAGNQFYITAIINLNTNKTKI